MNIQKMVVEASLGYLTTQQKMLSEISQFLKASNSNLVQILKTEWQALKPQYPNISHFVLNRNKLLFKNP